MGWDVVDSLAWAAFLGMLGQSLRVADGVNKMYQQNVIGKFSWGRMAATLLTGACVGMAASLGHFVGWDSSATYFLAGYVGTDLIEKRAQALS